jgi:hypothetical protein
MLWIPVCLLAVLGIATAIAGALRRRPWQVGMAAVLAAAAVALAWAQVTRSPDPAPLDPNPSSSFQIVALGDSYISGEGAERYFPGSDEPDPLERNLCHRASTAYPYLVAKEVGASLDFLACSGATTADVLHREQYPRSPAGVAGGRPQLEELEEADPDLVLISIGGNDAGFAEIGIDCALPGLPDCRRAASFWLRRLEKEVYPDLVEAFSRVRRAARGAPVFAMTYPNPLGPKFCSDLAGLDEAEMAFVREVFAPRLNELVESAAAVARVRTIDLESAFAGYRFCEKPLGRTAANFVALERTGGSPIARLGDLGKGSLHPNPLGHTLLEKRVLPVVRAAMAGELPPLPPVPAAADRPPPFDVEELDQAPGGVPPPPAASDCAGGKVVEVTRASAEPAIETFAVDSAQPGSNVCFRTYRAGWSSRRADGTGRARIPIDVSAPGLASVNEILVERQPGHWQKIVVSRLGAADEGAEPPAPSMVGLYLLIAAIVLAAIAVIVILVWFEAES